MSPALKMTAPSGGVLLSGTHRSVPLETVNGQGPSKSACEIVSECPGFEAPHAARAATVNPTTTKPATGLTPLTTANLALLLSRESRSGAAAVPAGYFTRTGQDRLPPLSTASEVRTRDEFGST